MLDILFVTPTERLELRQESNGSMLLATKLLQAGFSVRLLRFGEDENYNKDYNGFVSNMVGKILDRAPACVSFYTVWPDYHVILKIAEEVKKRTPETCVVFGGPQASATAAATMKAMPFVDYISSGEGENTVVPFFEAVLRGKGQVADVPGGWYRKDGMVACNCTEQPLCDLNTLPYWDERLYCEDYPLDREKMSAGGYYMPIDAGRGCPFNCTFCCTSHFWRRTYRLKSTERIIEDILYYKEKFGIRSFWFSHDAFTTNKKLVMAVCDRIIELGLDIQWRCTTRIDCITEELIIKMKQAGLVQIEVGIETGSARMQKLTNKNLNLSMAKSKIQFMLQNKLEVGVFFMYGFPEETEEDLADTLELQFSLLDMGVSYSTMSYCHFTPNTQITQDSFDKLVLAPEIKVLGRGIFGFAEELPMIKANKEIFPHFYHLHTTVRDEYQYLVFLLHLYQRYPIAMQMIRKLYNGDNLQFYRDFCRRNQTCFAQDIDQITACISQRPVELLGNVLDGLETPYGSKLRGLLEYEYDLLQVKNAEGDVSLQKTYDFSVLDLQRKRPIEAYKDVQSTILIEKKNGIREVRILDIQSI